MKEHKFQIKRVYETPAPTDGSRFLVDRLWPRGIPKQNLPMTEWLPAVAPSPELRKWFGHEAVRWTEFHRRYRAELANNPAAWASLLAAVQKSNVTLLYAARDPKINHASVLCGFLQEKHERQ